MVYIYNLSENMEIWGIFKEPSCLWDPDPGLMTCEDKMPFSQNCIKFKKYIHSFIHSSNIYLLFTTCQPHQLVPIGDFVPPPPPGALQWFFPLPTVHWFDGSDPDDGVGSPSSIGPRWRLHLWEYINLSTNRMFDILRGFWGFGNLSATSLNAGNLEISRILGWIGPDFLT